MVRNPIQPFIKDEHGTLRFKENKIVRYLLDFASNEGYSLNNIVGEGEYSQDDLEQFAQLIGYSLCGFHEITYVSDETALEASELAKAHGFEGQGCRDNGCPIHIGVERE